MGRRRETTAGVAGASTVVVLLCLAVAWPPPAAGAGKGRKRDPRTSARGLDESLLASAAFVSVDFQPSSYEEKEPQDIPAPWRALGITAADANRAGRHLIEIALPNGRRVADASRKIGLPLVFVHWGYMFSDGMDLDPVERREFMRQYGPSPETWPHHISRPDSRPADELGVRRGEYVIPKSGQDAFGSSNLAFVLENLGAETLIFVGGFTGGCLGRTVRSAVERGYRALCVADASFDASFERRLMELERAGCHHIVSTADFEELSENRWRVLWEAFERRGATRSHGWH